ncbi:hypothetical protein SNEBB_008028 [Seison nebaliae]|nr:hypothetical protein SNEBB_008028 [Seison nebaliae]
MSAGDGLTDQSELIKDHSLRPLKICSVLGAASYSCDMSIIIVMVGLPARGKLYTATKLARYFNWIGIRTKVFGKIGNNEDVEDDENEDEEMNELYEFIDKQSNSVAIYYGEHLTRESRQKLLDKLSDKYSPSTYNVMFVESDCKDESIIDKNILDTKVENIKNLEKFKEKIAKKELIYESMDLEGDVDLCFLKIIDVGRRFIVHNIRGHIQSRTIYFLMNMSVQSRSIYLTRHGESLMNREGKIGGDSDLSQRGKEYAIALAEFMRKEDNILDIWTSSRKRTIQTAMHTTGLKEVWPALDEIDAGICEGLTYKEIASKYPKEFAERDRNKYRYRYPSGESYHDLVLRVEPVIMELERSNNVLVVGHQAVLRCILAYFTDVSQKELPYLKVPLHCVLKLIPTTKGCVIEKYPMNIPGINTHRPRPSILENDRSLIDALSTIDNDNIVPLPKEEMT